jgi:hypothetical protein
METGQIKIAYLWLEFRPSTVQLRGRWLAGRFVVAREIRYDEITQLVLLIAAARPGGRGIRIRLTGTTPESVYFFTRPATVPLIADRFGDHGVALAGQITSTRLPQTRAFVYREDAPVVPQAGRERER